MRRLLSHSVFALGLAAALVVACGDDEPTTPSGGSSSGGTSSGGAGNLVAETAVVKNYAANVYANYEEVLAEAKKLQTAITAFTDAPTDATLAAAKEAWIAARKPYGPSEVYRFYEGPIDNETDGPEGDINAWPLDEQAIDYVEGMADAGLILNNDFVITKETIAEQNTVGGEASVTIGYHAIEFLLWGQDLEAPSAKTTGKRPVTDYTTSPTAERRKAYLNAVAELLVDDLTKVTEQWAPTATYRTAFEADVKGSLQKMIKGIGEMALGELAGERMSVAYTEKAQEEEHSCFSDTTNADLRGNFIGIKNVYLGTYGTKSGDGLSKLVASADAALDTKMKADLATAEALFDTIVEEPFDYAIALEDDEAAPRKAVRDAIEALKVIADDIKDVTAKLGLTVTIDGSENTL